MRAVPLLCLGYALAIASIADMKYYKIPNAVTYPTMLLGLVYHIATNGFDGCLHGLTGLMVGIGLLLPFHVLRMMGAGDVKLMGSVGAFLGPWGALNSFLYIGMAGGIYALIVLVSNPTHLVQFIRRFVIMSKTLLFTRHVAYIPPTEQEKKIKLCYGVAIAVGTMVYMFYEYMEYSSWSELFSALMNKVI